MRLELEALGEHPAQSARAALDVVEAITDATVEMMVVLGGDVGGFVAIRGARDGDVRDHAIILKPANRAIDGSQPQ